MHLFAGFAFFSEPFQGQLNFIIFDLSNIIKLKVSLKRIVIRNFALFEIFLAIFLESNIYHLYI